MLRTEIFKDDFYNVKKTEDIVEEMLKCDSDDFNIGEHIYMGMGLTNGHRVVMSVGYKIDYCIKKAVEFQRYNNNVTFTHVNKVKVGELQECKKFSIIFNK